MAKIHLAPVEYGNVGHGLSCVTAEKAQGNIDPADLAAVYAVYADRETGNRCERCKFGKAIYDARRQNFNAVQTEWSRIGHMGAVKVVCPLGDQAVQLVWGREDHRLDKDEARYLATSLEDAFRSLAAREQIEKRVSEPQCVEDGCHSVPIGWLDVNFSERHPRDVAAGIPARDYTGPELMRCEAHQPAKVVA